MSQYSLVVANLGAPWGSESFFFNISLREGIHDNLKSRMGPKGIILFD